MQQLHHDDAGRVAAARLPILMVHPRRVSYEDVRLGYIFFYSWCTVHALRGAMYALCIDGTVATNVIDTSSHHSDDNSHWP